MNEKIRGKIIGLGINGVKVQCEISSDFSFDVEMRNATAVTSGRWKEVIPGVRSWQMSVNANLLASYTGSGYTTILNALLSGELLTVTWGTLDGSLVISGVAYLSSGGSQAPNTGLSQWNATFIGSGAVSLDGEIVEQTVRWTYQSIDPFGDEGTITYKYNKSYNPLAASLSLDYTKLSTGNYLAFSVPTGYPAFNIWENNQFNSGTIPDFVWREKVTTGGRDVYVSRDPVYFTSDVPTIVYKNKSTTPNSYAFNDIVSALLSTEYISNEVTVAGITEPVPISLVGGLGYSINGGSYVTTDGFISNGDKVRVKLMTSASYLTMVSATLTIGGVSDSYDVTTQADAALFYAYASQMFTKNDCTPPQEGNSLLFERTYTGATQPDADAAKSADAAQFLLDGQANVNSLGSCAVPYVEVWGKIEITDEETVGTSIYGTVTLWFYKGSSTTVAPDPISGNLIEMTLSAFGMQYRQEGTTPASPVNFDVSVTVANGIVLTAPSSSIGNPVYPKQLLELSDGTFFYFAPPAKPQDTMFYIGSYPDA